MALDDVTVTWTRIRVQFFVVHRGTSWVVDCLSAGCTGWVSPYRTARNQWPYRVPGGGQVVKLDGVHAGGSITGGNDGERKRDAEGDQGNG